MLRNIQLQWSNKLKEKELVLSEKADILQKVLILFYLVSKGFVHLSFKTSWRKLTKSTNLWFSSETRPLPQYYWIIWILPSDADVIREYS